MQENKDVNKVEITAKCCSSPNHYKQLDLKIE